MAFVTYCVMYFEFKMELSEMYAEADVIDSIVDKLKKNLLNIFVSLSTHMIVMRLE